MRSKRFLAVVAGLGALAMPVAALGQSVNVTRSIFADQPYTLIYPEGMVAVGGAGKGHSGRDRTNLWRGQVGLVECPSEPLARRLQHEARHGIGAAERLEAAEAEPLAFVLEMQRADAERRSEIGQGPQRRRHMLGAAGEVPLRRLETAGMPVEERARLAVEATRKVIDLAGG